ncbi:MAG: alpha-amylase family glycosyl hydrolase [Bacteroidota bacterium]
MSNPVLYQINTRVWRKRFGANTQLLDVPQTYWQQLAHLGVDFVWLMGVWQTGPNVHRYALAPELLGGYTKALPDWQPQDVIGSPYAIDAYELHSDLGKKGDLLQLKARLHAVGLRLILDFVPNHFHAETRWLRERPDVFLEADEAWLARDASTYYRPPTLPGRVFAHGKDPYFTAWQDTLQVNYAAPAAQEFMQSQLLQIAGYCDGVRCDMAMLLLPKVIRQTWGSVLGAEQQQIADFWPNTIQTVKQQYPGFQLLAEVYWDLEWELQQQGFDYTYDKRLLDRLHEGQVQPIREHLWADATFQQRSARFLENHDEDRFLATQHEARTKAAAMITYTTPGLRFFYQGQWEGRAKRLPVQLGREPQEQTAANENYAVTNAMANLPQL